MPLATEFIGAIETALNDACLAGDDPLTVLRCRYPDVRFSRCDAGDVIESPYRENDRFNLYLIDGSSHCPCITSNPMHASRVLIGDK